MVDVNAMFRDAGINIRTTTTPNQKMSLEKLHAANTIKGMGFEEATIRPEEWDEARQQYPEFDQIFHNVVEKIYLDIGVGFGSKLFAYLRVKDLHPARRIALDLDENTLMHPYHQDGREIKHASFTNIPFPNGSIDVVFSNDTTTHDHQLDYEKYVEVRRVIKDEGVYVAHALDGHPHDFNEIGFEVVKLGYFAVLYYPK